MITSKLTTKARTTIPKPVRNALGVTEGDGLAYHIDGDRVILTRATSHMGDDPFVLFVEWDGEADRKAYASLYEAGNAYEEKLTSTPRFLK